MNQQCIKHKCTAKTQSQITIKRDYFAQEWKESLTLPCTQNNETERSDIISTNDTQKLKNE